MKNSYHLYRLFLVVSIWLIVKALSAHSDSTQLIVSTLDPLHVVDDITSLGEPLGELKDSIESIRNFIGELKDSGNYMDSLLQEAFFELPVGIKKEINNTVFTLGLSSIRLMPTYAEIDLFLEIDLPELEKDPIFIASNVKFSRKGGLSTDVEMYLLGNFPINLRQGKSKIILQGKNASSKGTYATIGCDGFKTLNLEGIVVFSRDWFIPINSAGIPLSDSILQVAEQNGTAITEKPRVKAKFAVNGQTSWNMLAELSDMTAFAIKDYEDIHIKVDQVSLDWSEVANPSSLSFPADYQSPFVSNGQAMALWKGLHIQNLSVQAPPIFKDATAPLQVLGEGFIIDDQGFSGIIEVQNLLPLAQGKLDKWPASIDTLKVDIMAMQVREARMAGLIHLPLLAKANTDASSSSNSDSTNTYVDPEDCLGYTVAIQAGNRYLFGVSIQQDYSAPVWKAQVTLAANSRLDLQVDQASLSAKAILHGHLSIADDFRRNALVVDTLRFQNLVVSTKRPFIQTGDWAFPSHVTAHLGRFHLNFSEIYLQQDPEQENRVSLEFKAAIQIAGGNSPIAAGGSFGIEGVLEEASDRQRWRYDRFRVDGIWVEASTSAWGLAGGLTFFEDDSSYGTGFRGEVGVWFAGVSPSGAEEDPAGKGFQAVGQFGQLSPTDGEAYRYFFVDVMAQFGNGLPIGALQLMAIGGGVFNRMAPQNVVEDLSTPAAQTGTLGSSLSGVRYRPDPSRGLRIKASLVVASPGSKEAFSVNGTLEVVTNAAGGLDTVAVYGNVTMFGPIEWDQTYSADQSGITIYIHMLYDNVGDERGFTASADAFVNVANGKFRGNAGSPINYAGGLDLKFTNRSWYVNVGTPSQPLSLIADFGFVRPTMTAYLDIGNQIPPMPDLPEYVTQLTGGSRNFLRNESLYASGAGFAFGVAVEIPERKKQVPFTPFYYELGAGLGFDIMLQNYRDAHCANTNSGKLGINGWYASGQAWGFFSGAVGIRVNLVFVKGEFEILSAALAAVLQAKGPNPFWGSARIAARYRILGGLVKGHFRIKVEVGKECIIVGEGSDPMANIDLILHISPGDSTQNHPTSLRPSAISNLPFGESISLEENEYKLVKLKSNILQLDEQIPSTTQLVSGDNSLEESPADMLSGNSDFTYQLEVALLKKKGTYFTDTVKIETHLVSFQTGPGLDTIPDENILVAYPMRGQRNFYPQEYHEGYLKLRQGQADILNGNVQARFTASSGEIMNSAVDYSPSQKELTFTLPALSQDTYYHLEIIRTELSIPAGEIPTGNLESGTGGGPSPQSLLPVLTEAVVYQSYFRTSHFTTFVEKIESIPALTLNRFGRVVFDPPLEAFGTLELKGSAQSDPLIHLEADISNNNWFDSHHFQRLVYDHFPLSQGILHIQNDWRSTALGDIPVKAVQLSQGSPALITANLFHNGDQESPAYPDSLHFRFPSIVQQDYQRFKHQVDSLMDFWANREAFEINQYDGDAINQSAFDRVAPPDIIDQADLIYVLKLSCFNPDSQRGIEVGDCPNFSGEIPICPLPPPLRALQEADAISLASLRNQTFKVKVSYHLPGRTNGFPNSEAILQLKFQW